MKFCIIRLGKSSVPEIKQIDSQRYSYSGQLSLDIQCKQVPSEIEEGVCCFIWLGSDNNKGIPTEWQQGLRAIGTILKKDGGPGRNDNWDLSINVRIIFPESINQQDFLFKAPSEYPKISGMPVIGLNTHSNQTVQLIKSNEETQNVKSLIDCLAQFDVTLLEKLQFYYTKLYDEFYGGGSNRRNEIDEPFDNDPDFTEKEDKGGASIIHPFDPTKIDIRPQPLTILSIIKRLSSDPVRIDLNTAFQRKSDLWDEEKQSRLIESLLVRIPLPAFYFDGTSDKWLIVDGLQRISTLKNFIISKNFKLQGLEYLKNFEGAGWDDLPTYLQGRIEETHVTAYIINPGTPSEVKFNIFKRINTGGLMLTPQEIRHALNQGAPANFVAELASESCFIEAMGGYVPSNRMEDRDYVARFIGFYLDSSSYQPDLDSFLNNSMKRLYDFDEKKLADLKRQFKKAMIAAKEIFGTNAFRKKLSLHDRKKPVNKALFESVSVTLAKLTSEQLQKLKEKKEEVNLGLMQLLNEDNDFFRSVTSGTGDTLAVERRYQKLKDLFGKFYQ